MQNNIESLFVPYQIALDMKSIGFDEPCLKLWEKTILFTSLVDTSEFKKVVAERYCPAPLYQQAFRWFREKHDLDVISKPHIRKTKKYVCDPVNIRLEAKNTYEEAETACLLELINICKK
jgi:hypothetical protein